MQLVRPDRPIIDYAAGLIRGEIESQLGEAAKDTTALETQLGRLRTEQKNLARTVALASGDIPELVAEMGRRTDQIRRLEAELAIAQRTPALRAEMIAQAEAAVRKKLVSLRTALAGEGDAVREALQAPFPEGLKMRVVKWPSGSNGKTRQVFQVEGPARLAGFNLASDPTGGFSKLHGISVKRTLRCRSFVKPRGRPPKAPR